MNIFRTIGQFTPFISPELDTFGEKALQKTIVSNLPYFNLFENLFKYPVLVIGRLVVALIVSIFLAMLTLGESYQEVVQINIIDRFLPKIEIQITEPPQTGNFLQDWWQGVTATTQNFQAVVEREVWRNLAFQILAGEVFVVLRCFVFLVLYFSLFWVFGTNIASLEKNALQHQAMLGLLAKSILYKMQTKLNYFNLNQMLSKQESENIQKAITKCFDPKQTITKEEIEQIANFSVR